MRGYSHILSRMHSKDRKTIQYWNVEEIEGDIVIRLYSNLVGQGMLEFVMSFVEQNNGAFRLFPDRGFICIEMKIKAAQ